jgi:ATP-dependent helicase HrpB
MSATLERERLASFLRAATGVEAPMLSVPGQAHAVRTLHLAPPERGPWEQVFADAVSGLATEANGTVLAFLPGMREIRRVSDRLAEVLSGTGVGVETLHGSMPLEEQRRVIAAPVDGGSPTRRVILATSVAETSLTVPGVRVVADSGWARTNRFHAPTGMDRLVTERVSVSSAEQRRGRAGRLGPGTCLRFWPETLRLLPTPEPEILRSDLTALVLECAVWGARRPGDLAWLDPPPRSAWDLGVEALRTLSFLDADGVPTPAGRDAAALGLHPRLAALVRAGRDRGGAHLAAVMAATIEERDGSGLDGEPDFRLRLAMLRNRNGGSPAWRAAVTRESQRILHLLHARASGWDELDEERAGDLLARAFPDRLARREPDGLWRFLSGRTAGLIPGAGLALLRAVQGQPDREEWLVAAEVDAGEAIGSIRLAAPVSRPVALAALAPVTREIDEVRWTGLRPKGVRITLAGRLRLGERSGRLAPESLAAAFSARLQAEGLEFLPWNDRSRRLLERLRFYARRGGELTISAAPPDGGAPLADRHLAASAGEWLVTWLDARGGPALTADHVASALHGLARSRGALDRVAPESITLPTGGKRRIDYSGAEPVVEARIQEVFGLTATPLLGGVPLTFRLLSPASRPLQTTRDLASFWATTYPEVRKEMRGRYPKHLWPENPLDAEPTTRTKRRGG